MSNRPFRYDSGQLRKSTITPQGYLKADAFATRSGIFIYRKPDGSVQRELRPEEEVFHVDSLSSLAEVPVTNDHPQQPLNVENTKLLAVGYTGSDVGKINEFVKCGVTIYDKDTIKAIMHEGKRELSGGYTCDIEMTPGIHNDMPYDAVQRNIRYNHLAVVKDGRAGHEASLKLDSQDAVMVMPEKKDGVASENEIILNEEIQKGEFTMAKVKIGLVEHEVSDAVATLINKMDADLSASTKENDQKQAKLDAIEALKADAAKKIKTKTPEEEDEEQEQEGELDSKKKDKSKKMDRQDAISYGREFAEAEIFGRKVIGAEFKTDSMELIDLKKAICAKGLPQIKLDGKSEDYVNAMFDSFKASYKTDDAKKLQSGLGDGVIRTDAGNVDVQQARMDSMSRTERRWQVPFDKLEYAAPVKK
jgi:hypothetical protein